MEIKCTRCGRQEEEAKAFWDGLDQPLCQLCGLLVRYKTKLDTELLRKLKESHGNKEQPEQV